MIGFPVSISSLRPWFPSLLLLLNMSLQVIAMLESHSRQSQNLFDCNASEYLSNGLCCEFCPAGTFVLEPCRIPNTQGQCEKCHSGSFTESANGLRSCIVCSTCDKEQEMVADCSATSDRICQCQRGHYYYNPELPELCLPCTKCPQGSPVLQECNSTANTVCSWSASNPRNRLLLLLSPLFVLHFAIVVYCCYLRR